MKAFAEQMLHHQLIACLRRVRRHCGVNLIEVRPHVLHDPGRTDDLIEFDIVSSHQEREHSNTAKMDPAWIASPRSAPVSENRMRCEFHNLYGCRVEG